MSVEPENVAGAPAGNTFLLKDCALIAIATGRRAYNLKELRDHLLTVSADSIYYHFWGGLLHSRFEEREYNNDFAGWARHGLHDAKLAERVAVIDPTGLADIEVVRQQLVELVEDRLDESEYLKWARATEPFEFIRSQIVVFDTHYRLERPEQLAQIIPQLSTSSIFYHFIDARRRLTGHEDDFSFWLSRFEQEACVHLCEKLAAIDPYFSTLVELRREVAKIFAEYF